MAAVRKCLMDRYIKADVGITGANAVAADSGSIALGRFQEEMRKTGTE